MLLWAVVLLEVAGVAMIAALAGAARGAAVVGQVSFALFVTVSLVSMIAGWILAIVLLAADLATVPEIPAAMKVPGGA